MKNHFLCIFTLQSFFFYFLCAFLRVSHHLHIWLTKNHRKIAIFRCQIEKKNVRSFSLTKPLFVSLLKVYKESSQTVRPHKCEVAYGDVWYGFSRLRLPPRHNVSYCFSLFVLQLVEKQLRLLKKRTRKRRSQRSSI